MRSLLFIKKNLNTIKKNIINTFVMSHNKNNEEEIEELVQVISAKEIKKKYRKEF